MTRTCARHPANRAGWFCHDCDRALCPECTAVKRFHPVDLLVCCLCGGRADVLRIRRETVPFEQQLDGVWRFPLQRSSLPALFGMSIVIMLFQAAAAMVIVGARLFPVLWALAPMIGLTVVYMTGIIAGWVMSTARKTAGGADGLENLEIIGLMRDVIRPAWLAVVGTAWVWVPLVFRLLGKGEAKASDPVLWLLAVAALGYLPMVLLAGAAGGTTIDVLNPVRNIARIGALGGSYGRVFFIGLLTLPPMIALQLLSVRAWAVVPLLGPYVLQVAAVYFGAVFARSLGVLLRVHGDKLGFGADTDYLEPALPGAEPRGVR